MQIPTHAPTQNYQIALFPLNPISTNWNTLFSSLLQLPEFVSGDNFIVPVPTDTPGEIPRIILKSADQSISCSISPEKIDFFWNNLSDSNDFSVTLDQKISLIGQIVGCVDQENIFFKRIGSIHNFYISTQSFDPVRLEIFREGIIRNLHDYSLRLSYRETLLDTTCNFVFDLTSATHKQTGESLLIIQADLNNHQESNVSWSLENIRSFITDSEPFLVKSSIIERLFPETN